MQPEKRFKYWQWRVIICSMIGYAMFYTMGGLAVVGTVLIMSIWGLKEGSAE